MKAHVNLSVPFKKYPLRLELHENAPSYHDTKLEECAVVYEDGWYTIDLALSKDLCCDLQSAVMYVNGTRVGITEELDQSENAWFLEGRVAFDENKWQPFLLLYDLVRISFDLNYSDGSSIMLYSSYLLCVTRNADTAQNVENMINDILSLGMRNGLLWRLFTENEPFKKGAMTKAEKVSNRPLSDYVSMVESIYAIMKYQYRAFKDKAQHKLKKHTVLTSPDNVKRVSKDNLNWLMQNTNQLAVTSGPSAIHHQGKNLMPLHIQAESYSKSLDTYENHVVLDFIFSVLSKAVTVNQSLHKTLAEEERSVTTVQRRTEIDTAADDEYSAPIVILRASQLSFNKKYADRLDVAVKGFQSLYREYATLLGFQGKPLTQLPRKTKVFQEVTIYSTIYGLILKWYDDQEYDFSKEKLLLKVKTLDSIFEYYCYFVILASFFEEGYVVNSSPKLTKGYEYKTDDGLFQGEDLLCNTIALQKDSVKVTMYFQPVIYADHFENGISLFRTRCHSRKSAYYTPDFILKFEDKDGKEEYVILDAKFAKRGTIINSLLPEVIDKYSLGISAAAEVRSPRMVWILQGRIDQADKMVWHYEDSPLTEKYRPATSFGILAVSTSDEVKGRLWDAFKNSLDIAI